MKKRGPKEGFQCAIHVPKILIEIEDQLNCREKLFCALIYSIYKATPRHLRSADDMWHMADNDFINVLGWSAGKTDEDKFLQNIRKVFRLAHAGGYWRIQWSQACLDYEPTKSGNGPAWWWTYLQDPHAVAIWYYIIAKQTQGPMTSDWYEGQDLVEFYREPVLRRTEYNLMKFQKKLYDDVL